MTGIENVIKKNHLQQIRLFKQPDYINELNNVLTDHIEDILTLCMSENSYKKMQRHSPRVANNGNEMHLNMMFELMHIEVINQWMLTHLHQVIQMAIASHSVAAWSLCMHLVARCSSRDALLSEHGFDYAEQALNSKNSSMLHVVLQQEIILNQVIAKQNALLMAAIKQGYHEDALYLLSFPAIAAHANANSNEALLKSSLMNDFSLVSLRLLELSSVAPQTANNLEQVMNNAINNQDYDLINTLTLLHLNSHQLTQLNFPNYAQLISCSIDITPYEMAILFDDYDNLSLLFNFFQNTNMLEHLLLYALRCSKQAMVAYMLNISPFTPELSLNNFFWHQLMHEAISSYSVNIMTIAFDIDKKNPFLHLFNNQLLQLCLDLGLVDIAHQMLGSNAVRDNAACLNNKVLRRACEYGYGSLVDELLTIDTVRDCVSAFEYAAFRKASLRHFQAIVNSLLNVPDVFAYACNNTTSKPYVIRWIIPYAITTLSVWMKDNNNLNQDQTCFLTVLCKSKLVEVDHETNDMVPHLIRQLEQRNHFAKTPTLFSSKFDPQMKNIAACSIDGGTLQPISQMIISK